MKPKLTLLGSGKTDYPDHPDKAKLEIIPFRLGTGSTSVTLSTDEFTSLCPVTAQPDFGEIIIEYVPGKYLVESKSLKLYLFSFRNIGSFQEEIVRRIMEDLKKAVKPRSIKVTGRFKARGGVSITPVSSWPSRRKPLA